MPAQVRVFAPGSVGNVGPGFDILGLAIGGLGDHVLAERVPQPGIVVAEPGHPSLPADPAKHTSAIAAAHILRSAKAGFGIVLRVEKGLPLAGGQGGSAASAVAGALAANLLLDTPLGTTELLEAALEAEAVVAGRHADNVVAILLGGLVLVRTLEPLEVVRLPVPPELQVVLAHPDQRMPTRTGRSVLPPMIPREDAIHQAAQVAALVAAAHSGDLALLGRSIEDRIAEPVRAPLLTGFSEAKRAALSAGALGCSISGSGPTAFALARDKISGERVAEAMQAAYGAAGVSCTTRVAVPDLEGARVES